MGTKENLKNIGFMNEIIVNTLNEVSTEYDIDINRLSHKSLLQLPKYTYTELMDKNIVHKEIKNISTKISYINKLNNYEYSENKYLLNLSDLEINLASNDIANHLFHYYHYIGYPRKDSINLGLFFKYKNEKKISSIISLSPFDLNHLSNFLPKNVQPFEVLILSRMYSFNWSPKNVISYMLSKMIKWLKNNYSDKKLILTYLNPNLGFSGVSYKASNWYLFAKEIDIKYAYLDGRYITLRTLKKLFNTTDIKLLKKHLKNRLTFSKIDLLPFEIYAYNIKHKLQNEFIYPIMVKKIPPIS